MNPEKSRKNEIREVKNYSSNLIENNPFYKSERLYLYYYDGRYKKLKDGIIDITKNKTTDNAALTISADTGTDMARKTFYSGSVIYSDMLIRFSFLNLYNTLEEDLLYIFNPMECRNFTEGLLCGISSSDLMPCAFKCIVSLTPVENKENLKKSLMISKEELDRWQHLNMMVVDNKPRIFY